MKSIESWEPTNIILGPRGWEPNREYIAPWSRHTTSLECPAYVETLERFARGDLLDVGAGTIPYYGVYGPLVESVTAIDWPGSSHDTAHVDIIANANNGLPCGDQTFDTVLQHSREVTLFCRR